MTESPQAAVPNCYLPAKISLATVIVVLPCFLQPHIATGDFCSHIYAAWIGNQARAGHIEGIALVHQRTNIFFDNLLMFLLRHMNAVAAEHISLATLALVFFWGCFCFSRAIAGRAAWALAPIIFMMTYGIIFEVGFDNFLLGTGICLFGLAALWRPNPWKMVCGAALLWIASYAHPMPMVWAAAILAFRHLFVRITFPWRMAMLVISAISLKVLALVLRRHAHAEFAPVPWIRIAGAGELARHGPLDAVAAVAVLAVAIGVFIKVARTRGWRALLGEEAIALYLLGTVGVAVLPAAFHFEHLVGGGFLAERYGFFATILLGATMSAFDISHRQTWIMVAAAALSFILLLQDAHEVTRIDAAVRAALQGVPRGSRVVGNLPQRVPPLEGHLVKSIDEHPFVAGIYYNIFPGASLSTEHFVDRACIDWCYSFANYELSSSEFQVKALPGSRIALWDWRDSIAAQGGSYIVRAADAPLYKIGPCLAGSDSYCARSVPVGELVGPGTQP